MHGNVTYQAVYVLLFFWTVVPCSASRLHIVCSQVRLNAQHNTCHASHDGGHIITYPDKANIGVSRLTVQRILTLFVTNCHIPFPTTQACGFRRCRLGFVMVFSPILDIYHFRREF
jgi:hypothetical protein